LDRLKAAIAEIFERLRADPERFEEVEKELQADLTAFRQEREGPKG
jgi:hypothetical protein